MDSQLIQDTAAALSRDDFTIDACVHYAAGEWQRLSKNRRMSFEAFFAAVMAQVMVASFDRLADRSSINGFCQMQTESMLWRRIPETTQAGETAGEHTIYSIARDHLGRRWGRITPQAVHQEHGPVLSTRQDGPFVMGYLGRERDNIDL